MKHSPAESADQAAKRRDRADKAAKRRDRAVAEAPTVILDLSRASLSVFALEHMQMPSEVLQSLVLSHNCIDSLKAVAIAPLGALRHLDLSHNSMREIVARGTTCSFPALQTLDLSHNEISRVGGLDGAPQLTALNLSNNKLKLVSNVGHLQSLVQLNLSANCLASMLALRELPMCKALRELNVEANAVTGLPRFRAQITHLLPQLHTVVTDHTAPPSQLPCSTVRPSAGKAAAAAAAAAEQPRGVAISQRRQLELDAERADRQRAKVRPAAPDQIMGPGQPAPAPARSTRLLVRAGGAVDRPVHVPPIPLST